MEIATLKKQIVECNLNPYYVFKGTELAVRDLYLINMAKCMDLKIKRAESLSEALQDMCNYSLMDDAAKLYVLWEMESVNEDISLIKSPNVVVVLDISGKSTRKDAEYIVTFDSLPEEQLVKYTKKELDLNESYAKKYIQICDCDYGRILSEADKIRRYSEMELMTHSNALKQMYEENVIQSFKYTDDFFVTIDEMLVGHTDLSHVYDKAIPFLHMLYNKVVQLVQVLMCDSDNVERTTGIPKWRAMRLKKMKTGLNVGNLSELQTYISKNYEAIIKGTLTGKEAIQSVAVFMEELRHAD